MSTQVEEVKPEPKPLVKLAFVSLALALIFAASTIFVSSFSLLVAESLSLSGVITFEKGSFYLFGGALGIFLLLVIFLTEVIFKRKLSLRIARCFNYAMLGCLALTLVIPHITHYFVSNFTEKNGYQICHEAGHQWLHSRTIVYVKSSEVCQQLVANGNQN